MSMREGEREEEGREEASRQGLLTVLFPDLPHFYSLLIHRSGRVTTFRSHDCRLLLRMGETRESLQQDIVTSPLLSPTPVVLPACVCVSGVACSLVALPMGWSGSMTLKPGSGKWR